MSQTLSIAEQIQRESKLRSQRSDELPSSIKNAKVEFNEDALYVHPDQLFLNPRNSRKTFNQEKIEGYAATMKQKGIGVIEPIIVRRRKHAPNGIHQYEVIAGDSRLLAARMAGMTRVPIMVRNANDRTARRINIIENLHRTDLADNEMGEAFVELKADMQLELEEFLTKAQFIATEEHDALTLDEITWNAVKDQYPDIPGWMHTVIERATEFRKRGRNQKPKVRWEDVAPEVGFTQVRSIHYYVSISKLAEDEEDEDDSEPTETERTEAAQEEEKIKAEVALAISSGELSQQQARSFPALNPPLQKVLLDAIRSEGLSGPAAQRRARELQGLGSGSGGSGGSSGSGRGRGSLSGETGAGFKAYTALMQLTDLSLPSEQIRAVGELGEITTKVRKAVEGRFVNYGPYDSHSKMLLRKQIKRARIELDALEVLAAPSNAAERAQLQSEEENDEPGLRLVG